MAQKVLEPRVDVAVGFIRLPEDRPASDRVSALARRRAPQPAVPAVRARPRARFHLDEFAIVPDELVPLLREHLPAEVGPPVRNEAVVTLEPYRRLLSQFVQGDAARRALPVGISGTFGERGALARR